MSAETPPWPKVTVMIPTYGQANVILRAVDSALAQDYPALEVLVVDDASPDDTREVVATRRDARLAYHRNDRNLGRVGNYRHALYDLAHGDWVVCLDGDDCFTDPGFVRAAVDAARSHPDAVIVAARATVEAPGQRFVSPIPAAGRVDGREVALRVADTRYHLMHLASMYRRSDALALDFYRDDVISSDWESLYRLACRGSVVFLDRVVGIWHVGGGSASQTTHWQQLARNMRVWQAVGAALTESGVPAARVQRAMDDAVVSIGYVNAAHLARSGRVADAVRFVLGMEGASVRARARLLLHAKTIARLLLGALTPRRGAAS